LLDAGLFCDDSFSFLPCIRLDNDLKMKMIIKNEKQLPSPKQLKQPKDHLAVRYRTAQTTPHQHIFSMCVKHIFFFVLADLKNSYVL